MIRNRWIQPREVIGLPQAERWPCLWLPFVQRALACPEYSGGDGGASGAFGVEWPSGGSYDEGDQNTEAPRFPRRKAMLQNSLTDHACTGSSWSKLGEGKIGNSL